jgi:hypothetical protein
MTVSFSPPNEMVEPFGSNIQTFGPNPVNQAAYILVQLQNHSRLVIFGVGFLGFGKVQVLLLKNLPILFSTAQSFFSLPG